MATRIRLDQPSVRKCSGVRHHSSGPCRGLLRDIHHWCRGATGANTADQRWRSRPDSLSAAGASRRRQQRTEPRHRSRTS